MLALVTILFPQVASAQVGSTSLAVEVPIVGDIADAAIICQSTNGFVACSKEFDAGIYGVVTDDPALSIEDQSLLGTRLAVTSGNTVVRVNSSGGEISPGDFITSSTVPGVGMRAARNGFVVGQALEGFSGSGEGQILVALNIHPTLAISDAQTDLLDALRRGLSFSFVSPLASLRFIIALIIILVSFVFGLHYFGRQARTGVEAVARNPLAKRTIQVSIFANVLLGLAVIVGGLILAALIIVF